MLRRLRVPQLQLHLEAEFSYIVHSVVSSSFRDVAEAGRQVRSCGCLLESLIDFERRDVEFVSTSKPEDMAALAASKSTPERGSRGPVPLCGRRRSSMRVGSRYLAAGWTEGRWNDYPSRPSSTPP